MICKEGTRCPECGCESCSTIDALNETDRWKTLAEEAAQRHGQSLKARDETIAQLREQLDKLDEQRNKWLIDLAVIAGAQADFANPQKAFDKIASKLNRTAELYRNCLATLAAWSKDVRHP